MLITLSNLERRTTNSANNKPGDSSETINGKLNNGAGFCELHSDRWLCGGRGGGGGRGGIWGSLGIGFSFLLLESVTFRRMLKTGLVALGLLLCLAVKTSFAIDGSFPAFPHFSISNH